ncbi:MAG: phospholipid carrier-dependent glycosyltransferase [Nanoarchaeota archaeon]|nr:phospholipid carrier-dependent glycosyltransferase [Nanoarchaeota archaeon]
MDKKLIAICVVLSAIALATIGPLWWDGATYIGMGKYLWSGGTSGLWEDSRPLVWPLLLGVIWKMGLPPVESSQGLAFIFALGCVVMTYLIGKKMRNERVGLIAALLVSFTPVFLRFSTRPLSEIPSTFFILLSVYFVLKNKAGLAGLFAGLACMTRFLQLLPALILGIWIVFKRNPEQKKSNGSALKGVASIKYSARFLVCFLLPVIPYLVFNLINYGNALHPFLVQIEMTRLTGWPWHGPWWWYLKELPWENFLLLLSIPATWIAFKKKTDLRLLSVIGFVSLIVYSLIAQKEQRFLLVFLPFLALLAASALPKNKLSHSLLIGAFLVQSLIVFPLLSPGVAVPDFNLPSEGRVWVSSPLVVARVDNPATPVYYSVFSVEKAWEISALNGAPLVISECDLLCRPGDSACDIEKEKLFSALAKKATVLENGDCPYLIIS